MSDSLTRVTSRISLVCCRTHTHMSRHIHCEWLHTLHTGPGGRMTNCWGRSVEVLEIKGGLSSIKFPTKRLHPVSSSGSEMLTHCVVVKFLCSFNFARLNELPLKPHWASFFPPWDVLFKRRATLTSQFYSSPYKPQRLKSQRSFVVVLWGRHQYYCFAFELFRINSAAASQKKPKIIRLLFSPTAGRPHSVFRAV